jgi:hypothetical protein
VLVGTGMKTGLKNRYDDPAAVGADRIVNAVAAGKHYGFPAIIVDIGTATSVEAVSGEGCYLGGAILTSLYLPQLRDSTQVRLCQPVSDPTASGDVQVRVQVREPLEIEGARHAPVRNLQPRFLYDLFGEEQHVYVHGARRFLPLVLAP